MVQLVFILLMTIQRHTPFMIGNNHQVLCLVVIHVLYMTVMQVVMLVGRGIHVQDHLTVSLVFIDTIIRCTYQHTSVGHRCDINNDGLHHIKCRPLSSTPVVTIAAHTVREEQVLRTITTNKRTAVVRGCWNRRNLPYFVVTKCNRIDLFGGHHQRLVLIRVNLYNVSSRLR